MRLVSLLLLVAIITAACATQSNQSVATEVQPAKRKDTGDQKLRDAIPIEGKDGFVRSPYSSNKTPIDVRGFPKGTNVVDPHSGKMFLVPFDYSGGFSRWQ
jgi:hypothetical protein